MMRRGPWPSDARPAPPRRVHHRRPEVCVKVCYVDESGMQETEPVLVMVGIVVDGQRLNRTREDLAEIFGEIQGLFPEALKELKGTKIFYGRDRWRDVSPDVRKRIFEFLCGWLAERKHHLALAAIDKASHRRLIDGGAAPEIKDPWLAAALHVALQIQKAHQGHAKNKGHTFLIFDENKSKVDHLPQLLYEPPAWSDTYYSRSRKQAQLDQVIDAAFFVKSHHAGLVQVADLFAFVFRRLAEFADYGSAEVFDGERSLIEGYSASLAVRLLPRAHRWSRVKKSDCAEWFRNLAPTSLKALG